MKEVTPQEGLTLIEQGALLVDVREPDEFAEVHAAGARLVPLGELSERWEELPKQPLVLICRSGVRSARAAEFLETKGYEVINLAGGTQAWQEAGLPVETASQQAGAQQ